MPNHVKNVLKFKNLKVEDIDLILNTICTKDEENTYHIDFDKIIPEPKIESECPEDCLMPEHSCIAKYEDRPWFDWFTWRNKYWGTKWDAYESYSVISDDNLTLVFNTAWSAPIPIINELSLLGYDFELRYADEDLGNNCGIIEHEKGLFGYLTKSDGLKHYEQFAEQLWEEY